MEKILNFASFNFYSKCEYKSQKSVLDAAFFLLYRPVEDESINLLAYNFIVYIYSLICIGLINDDDEELLQIDNNYNNIMLFVYNLIYMKNSSNYRDKNYICFYKNINFNYIIDNFLYNRGIENDDLVCIGIENFDYNSQEYEKDIIDYVESTLLDSEILFKENDINTDIQKWKIYMYIIVYYYILLINDIKNQKNGANILLKTLKNIIVIYNYIFKLNDISEDEDAEFQSFLNDTPFFNDIFKEAYGFCIDDDGNIRFELFEELFLRFSLDNENCVFQIRLIINQKYNVSNKIQTAFFYEIVKTLFSDLSVSVNDTIEVLNDIVEQVRKSSNYFSFKKFYTYFMKSLLNTEDSNVEIIDEVIRTRYPNEIIFNIFDGCMYSLLFVDIEKSNIIDIFKNLCNQINKIYINSKVTRVIYDINIKSKSNAKKFFVNYLNLYKKILLTNIISREGCNVDFLIYHVKDNNSGNNDEDNDNGNSFYLKDLELQDLVFTENTSNIKIGHSSLGKTKTPKIPLTKTLFYSNSCYRDNQITLENLEYDFFTRVCS